MRPIELVLSLLQDVRETRSGWAARCPAHQDSRPSLTVAEGHSGGVVLHCFAGCGGNDIVDALGLTWSQLYPEGLAKPTTHRQTPSRSAPERRSPWRPTAADALDLLDAEALSLEVAARHVKEHGPSDEALEMVERAAERVAFIRKGWIEARS